MDARQFLTFKLGDEEYGFDLLKVQEIKGYTAITPLPNAPDYVKGVLNLRGAVVPIVGLREKFAMPSVDYDKFTVIVMVTVAEKVVGLVVDAVSDVLSFEGDAIEQAPELGGQLDTSFISGMAKVSSRLVTLLDIERVVGIREAAALA